jgi:hypothetical protein
MGLKPGSRLRSRVSDAEFVVIRTSNTDEVFTAGGIETVALDSDAQRVESVGADSDEALLGKRYVDDLDTFEVLCTKAGVGTLAIDNRPLHPKTSKPLPSSD